MIFIGGYNGSLIYWLCGHNQAPHTLISDAHRQSIDVIAWHPAGHCVGTASHDGILKFWCREPPGNFVCTSPKILYFFSFFFFTSSHPCLFLFPFPYFLISFSFLSFSISFLTVFHFFPFPIHFLSLFSPFPFLSFTFSISFLYLFHFLPFPFPFLLGSKLEQEVKEFQDCPVFAHGPLEIGVPNIIPITAPIIPGSAASSSFGSGGEFQSSQGGGFRGQSGNQPGGLSGQSRSSYGGGGRDGGGGRGGGRDGGRGRGGGRGQFDAGPSYYQAAPVSQVASATQPVLSIQGLPGSAGTRKKSRFE